MRPTSCSVPARGCSVFVSGGSRATVSHHLMLETSGAAIGKAVIRSVSTCQTEGSLVVVTAVSSTDLRRMPYGLKACAPPHAASRSPRCPGPPEGQPPWVRRRGVPPHLGDQSWASAYVPPDAPKAHDQILAHGTLPEGPVVRDRQGGALPRPRELVEVVPMRRIPCLPRRYRVWLVGRIRQSPPRCRAAIRILSALSLMNPPASR